MRPRRESPPSGKCFVKDFPLLQRLTCRSYCGVWVLVEWGKTWTRIMAFRMHCDIGLEKQGPPPNVSYSINGGLLGLNAERLTPAFLVVRECILAGQG